MDRIYMNRIDGQRRIHVEITDSEVSDLLEDLQPDPEHYDSTTAFLALLDAAEEVFSPVVAEGRRDRAARQAAGQPAADEQPLAIPRDVAQAIHDALGQLLTAPAAGLAAPTNHNTETVTTTRWVIEAQTSHGNWFELSHGFDDADDARAWQTNELKYVTMPLRVAQVDTVTTTTILPDPTAGAES